jgi:hypothetical protein
MTDETVFEGGFEAYKIYVALKAHFTRKNYDYFKYNGKTNVTMEAFRKRNDRMFFVRLSKNMTLEALSEYFLSNLITDETTWIGEIHNNMQRRKYFQFWKMKLDNLEKVFDADTGILMMTLVERKMHFNSLFAVPYGKQPIILQMLFHGKISLESFIIMNQLVNFFDHFNNDLKGNPIWENIEIKCVKYEPFLRGEHGGPISNYNTFKNILVPKVKQLNVLPFNQNKGGNEDNAE